MGTRAQAFIGNPHDYENRRYLGSVAYDGYNLPPLLAKAKTADEFEAIWKKYIFDLDHYCSPDKPYPFPWAEDIFISDITIAWFAPEGHPEAAYRDDFLWGADVEAHPSPYYWPEESTRSKRKAVWLPCAEEAKIEGRAKRREAKIEKAIQAEINKLPYEFETAREYHECKAFQAEAEAIRKKFADKFDASSKRQEKEMLELVMKSAPIPGPAVAHSAYVRQPEADSIMLISLG